MRDSGLALHHPGADIDAGIAQDCQPLAGNPRVGIGHRCHQPGDAGCHEGIGARRGFALMRARLERDIGGGTASGIAGFGNRLHLGMRPPAGRGPAASDNPAAAGFRLNDNRADGGIGARPPEIAPAEPERRGHHSAIELG